MSAHRKWSDLHILDITKEQLGSIRRCPARALAPLLLALAIAHGWWASSRQGGDWIHPYATAVGVANGYPIYDRAWQQSSFAATMAHPMPGEGTFYPPATGFATLPLAFVIPRAAKFLWFVLLVTSVTLGIRGLVRLVKPDATREQWMLLAGLVLFSSCLRWGMTPLQAAPGLMALLAHFGIALEARRQWVVLGLAVLVMAFKFTVALPFLALLVLHRRYLFAAITVASSVVLNLLGFIRMGGRAAFTAYLAGMHQLESTGTINTPDPWELISSSRLDWTYLFVGLTRDIPLARGLALTLSAVTAAWLAKEGWRVRRHVDLTVTASFLLPATCLSLLCVYHHHYDISLLVVPLLILGFLHVRDRRPVSPAVLALAVPVMALMAFLPVATSSRLLEALVGPRGPGLVNLAFPVALTLALVGSLLLLRQNVRRRLAAAPPRGQPATD